LGTSGVVDCAPPLHAGSEDHDAIAFFRLSESCFRMVEHGTDHAPSAPVQWIASQSPQCRPAQCRPDAVSTGAVFLHPDCDGTGTGNSRIWKSERIAGHSTIVESEQVSSAILTLADAYAWTLG
jgi:hypothetical protein